MRNFHAKAHPEAKKFDGGLGEDRGTETGLLGCVYVILGKDYPPTMRDSKNLGHVKPVISNTVIDIITCSYHYSNRFG